MSGELVGPILRRGRPLWRLAALICLVVTSAILTAGLTAWWSRTGAGPAVDSATAEAIIGQVIREPGCTNAAYAERGIAAGLASAGVTGWDVRNQLLSTTCVTAVLNSTAKRVTLIPALSVQVRAALDALTEELYNGCLGENEIVARLGAILDRLGEADYEIATDGPVTAPVDRAAEVLAHVEAGCWIYSGSGWTPDGRRTHFVTGR